jgi:hypothetical protein
MQVPTPGEWRITKPDQTWEFPEHIRIWSAEAVYETAALIPPGPNADANAHLIAAAPDLLAAGDAVITALRDGTNATAAVGALLRAITKARGATEEDRCPE